MVKCGAKLIICLLFFLNFASCIDKDRGNKIPVSTEQYNISPDGKGIVFNACTEKSNGLSYQWYEGNDSLFEHAQLIEDATAATYNTGKISKGIHYFFCAIKNGQGKTTLR